MRDKRKRSKLTPEQVETLYVVGLKTMQEIAQRAGITRQAVREILERRDVEYRGGTLGRVCERCGATFQAARYRVQKGEARFCSPRCNGLVKSGRGETLKEQIERVLEAGKKA